MALSYSQYFYEEMKDSSLASARAVVPLVYNFTNNPRSVVDIGCGTGNWLKAFQEQGVQDITGIDGSWVKEEMLVIPRDRFIPKNIEERFTFDGKADLAMSLEVAEHVPADQAANLVRVLTSIAPVVFFSAAIPMQGGARHINEQWPEYWAKLFAAEGYVPVDCLRRRVWDDSRVSFFYAQNMFIYVAKSAISNYPLLAQEIEAGFSSTPALVHPYKYLYFGERWESIVPYLGKLPPSLLHAGKRFLKKLSALRQRKGSRSR